MTDLTLTLCTRLPAPASAAGDRPLFVPALDRFPPRLRALMGLLPVCDINGGLLAALAGQRAPHPEPVVAGLFAADPFLDARELAAALRRAGILAVANYPTLQLLDGTTAEGLAAVGYHAQSEFARLQALAEDGFEALAYVTSVQAAEAAIACGLASLVIHPEQGGGPARAVAGRIAATAGRAGARILHHTPIASD
ncbi:phosphoenolpyruvate hydrolase-like protein [Stella humosa]|uniref:Phosphoenolpyruvate hydrolase-like protein n=1 Tax=Stella humosa TaxID=94 RepID=A0A3N1KXN1_9PROT|nr:phosphoenolpyruvate hydrolase family protein [Stella humosa]ROP84007.1 phosphoenolpyruvate hydrolase-like protein [Stella humosa]BBK33516.1 hypothetical protein STHU_41500 [Stella humosa]